MIFQMLSLFQPKKSKSNFFSFIEKKVIKWSPFKNKPRSFFVRKAVDFLNGAQFPGVINDNLFKYLVVFLLIDLQGVNHTPIILTWVGVIYVLPFLFFSSTAGILADRFSKQRLIVLLKWTELFAMALGIFAFASRSIWASYSLLFLLSLQSAMFSPPKYSIIPELVEAKKIPKANGMITAFTYIGIIIGTFFASFLTQVTGRNFPLTAAVCTLIALFGLLCAIFIPYTKPTETKNRIHSFFIREIYLNLRRSKRVPYLLTTIFGSASFLMIGAYFQLNVIPFAVEELQMSEVAGGYLFLLTAIGIALGAFLAGKASKKRAEVGLSCLAGFGLSFVLIVIGSFPKSSLICYTGFVSLGVLGGFYVVPFDSFMQRFSPKELRGQVIAATNFLSFCGVLLAPLMLFLFSQVFHLSAAEGFIWMGIVLLTFCLFLGKNLSCFVFNSLATCFVKPFYQVQLDNSPIQHPQLFILKFPKRKRVYFYLLAAMSPKIHLYYVCSRKHFFDMLWRHFSALDFLYGKKKEEVANQFARIGAKDLGKGEIPCLVYPFFLKKGEEENREILSFLQEQLDCVIARVEVQVVRRKEQFERKFFKRAKVTFHFFLGD